MSYYDVSYSKTARKLKHACILSSCKFNSENCIFTTNYDDKYGAYLNNREKTREIIVFREETFIAFQERQQKKDFITFEALSTISKLGIAKDFTSISGIYFDCDLREWAGFSSNFPRNFWFALRDLHLKASGYWYHAHVHLTKKGHDELMRNMKFHGDSESKIRMAGECTRPADFRIYAEVQNDRQVSGDRIYDGFLRIFNEFSSAKYRTVVREICELWRKFQ